ncbi:MAG: preprotein translocase subunit SecG [Armatimonadota bacterium]
MELFAKLVLGLALLVAIVFALLVLVTGKGDAMSGGGSVRTSFKGKASFDDIISKWTLYMGVSFMGLVLLYTVVSNRVLEAGTSAPVTTDSNAPAPKTPAAPEANKPTEAANTPASAPDTNKPGEAAKTPAPDTNAPAKK